MHTFSVSIDVAEADPRHWCDHDTGRVSLRCNPDTDPGSIYLVGTLGELAGFATAILSTVNERLVTT